METATQIIQGAQPAPAKITREFLEHLPLSTSSLKEFRKSPKHYIQYLTQPREDKEVFMLGRLVECMLLEPDKVDTKFMKYTKLNLRTNAGKEEMNSILERVTELKMTVINEDLWKRAKKAAESAMDYNMSRELIEGKIKVQRKLKWYDKATGLPIIGYIDFDTNAWESLFVVDIKTTNNADPDEFMKQANKLEYFLQFGCYADGYPRCQFKFPNFAFLAIETDEPYNVSVNFCDAKYLDQAKDEFRSTVKAFDYCMKNNLFYQGYEFRLMGSVPYFSMQFPSWHKTKFNFLNDEK